MTAERVAVRYAGRTVVCAASGPSLTAGDLELVRQAGIPLVVCNDTWRLAPWAEVLVAMDTAWWLAHGEEAAAKFSGDRVAFTEQAGKFGASCTTHAAMLPAFGNTGAAAVALMARGRAAQVILIGYDAGAGPRGELHWHADHAPPLKNPQTSLCRWPQQFERVGEYAKRQGTRIVNCSRRTALACFERMELEEALRITPRSEPSGFSTSAASGGRTPAGQPSLSATGPG